MIRLLTSADAAELLGLRPRTLRAWRKRGVGPPWVRVGSRIHYRAADLWGWVRRQTVTPGVQHRDATARGRETARTLLSEWVP